MPHPLVVHCKQSPYDVYCGRPSKWGNPFSHKAGTTAKYKVKTRADAVSAYFDYFYSNPDLIEQADRELRGKVLGCWCAPQLCHCEILAEYANS